MTFGCAAAPARPVNGVIATLRNERSAAWRVKDTRRPPFWDARPARRRPTHLAPARRRPAHWHPRGDGHADGYLSPPAGTVPAPMTCGKLHILRAPPLPTRGPGRRNIRIRTGRAGEGKGAPDGGRAGGDTGDARGSGPDDPGPSAAPEDAGDARGRGPGAPARRVGPPARTRARIRPTTRTTSPSRSRRARGRRRGREDREARERRSAGRPAGANEKARNRWVSAGSGPALVVRGGGLEPP